jgi:hypothetical protein
VDEAVQFLLVLLLLAAAVAVISAPLRRPGRREEGDPERAALEAAKEAKYREIRDAELDWRTGKLSEQDWRALDDRLRAEALEILRRLEDGR